MPDLSVHPIGDPSPDDVSSWHRVVAASLAADLPTDPPPTLERVAASLTAPALGSRRLLWRAMVEGHPVGVAALRLFTEVGRDHLGELELHVHPRHRRAGVGTALLGAALEAARADGRRAVTSEAVDGTPGAAFVAAHGLRPVLSVRHLLLSLESVTATSVLPDAGTYELVRWTGTVPDSLADAFAAAKEAMADMPVGDIDYGVVRWDADRVRAMAQAVADRGDTLLTVAAVTADRAIAGFTEVVIPGRTAARAQQYDTTVVPAHRGHRLGVRLKAAMVEWLRSAHPGVREVETDNAEDNAHMLAVNEQLGFVTHRRTVIVQADLG